MERDTMLGDLFSAGTKIFEGFMNRSATKDANERAAAERAADRQAQFDFATKGIQWKAADARAAGLHPLFAMGASTHSYTPMAVGVTPETTGGALSSAGQDIGRAINATRNAPDRASAALQALTLERGQLENDLLRSQIAKLNAAPNPPMPVGNRYLIDGQGQTASGDLSFEDRWSGTSNLVKDKALERVPGAPGRLHQEPAAITDVGFAKTAGGGYAPVPSKDVKERIEDNIIQEVMHAVRNNIIPIFTGGNPPPVPADPGYSWRYDPYSLEYRQQQVRKFGPLRYRSWK